MKLPHRRHFLHVAAGAVVLPAVPRVARGQTYPTRAVRLIVGFPASGLTDILARFSSSWLSERLDSNLSSKICLAPEQTWLLKRS